MRTGKKFLSPPLSWIYGYDSTAVRDDVRKAIERLKKCGMKPAKMFFYVLVRDVDDALARIEELDALGCQPFAQPYRDFENKIRPTPEQYDA